MDSEKKIAGLYIRVSTQTPKSEKKWMCQEKCVSS